MITILSELLIVAGYFASPEGGLLWGVITNRSLAIFAIIVTAWALTKPINVEEIAQAIRDVIV